MKKDLAVLLYGYKKLREPNRLYDAKVTILLESTLVDHSPASEINSNGRIS